MRNKLRFRHGGYLLLLTATAYLVLTSQKFQIKNEGIMSTERIWKGNQLKLSNNLHDDVNIVPSVPPSGALLPPHECIPLPKSPKPVIQICIHPIKFDRAITKALKANRLWESDLVFQMQTILKRDSRMVLLDVGCNIGVYTLWAAALGNRVVAVDMLAVNILLLQTSLFLNRLSKRVTLINNAIYRDHRTLETVFFESSIGATRLNTSKLYKEEDTKQKRVEVQTICLNDLASLLREQNVYMKMDIENTEHYALACADQLFDQSNIKIVQMEWHRRVPEESIPILHFMSSHGYAASSSAVEYLPVDLGSTRERMDVFFLKKSEYCIH